MKQFLKAIILFVFTQYFSCNAFITMPAFTEERIHSGIIARERTNWCIDAIDYTNGGVSCSYPAGLFTNVPYVAITLELKNASYATTEQFAAVITSNSATQTTVRVNKIDADSVQEASDDDVIVHIFALDKP